MKNFDIKKEIWIWVVIIIPFLYLFDVWKSLPEMVPTHFGFDGKPNDWSHRWVLIIIISGMTIGLYLLMTFIPKIDPKKKIQLMGNKYFTFKLVLQLFMSLLSLFIIQSAQKSNVGNVKIVFVLVGALFVFLGNYMQTVKPNYFIGVRTPWTLENETVWKKTHYLASRMFAAAGLLIMILPFLLHQYFENVFIAIVLIAAFIPMIYSYVIFRQEKNKTA